MRDNNNTILNQYASHCFWALDNVEELFVLLAENGQIKAANASFCSAMKCAEDEVVGKPLKDFFPDEEEWNGFLKRIRTDEKADNLSLGIRAQDGSTLECFVHAESVTDPVCGEKLIRVVFKRVEKDLDTTLPNIEKMAALGFLAASVAHEINNPLNIILGYAQLLLDDFEPGTEEYENLKEIEKCSKMCRQVVSDLLKFSRAHEQEQKKVDMNECLEETLAVCSHQIMLARIELRKELSPIPLIVVGDPNKLKQVFLNLIVNAQQAIGEDGVISIKTDYNKQTNEVVISIKDSGCGIPTEIQRKIFEPFFTTKKVREGTGLGLAVSRNIIMEHGGRIEVRSKVNEGTEFIIYLPKAAGNNDVKTSA